MQQLEASVLTCPHFELSSQVADLTFRLLKNIHSFLCLWAGEGPERPFPPGPGSPAIAPSLCWAALAAVARPSLSPSPQVWCESERAEG